MKFLFIFCILLCLSNSVYSQYGTGSPKSIDELKKLDLVVILYEGMDNYNETVSEFIEKNWKYGAYTFEFWQDMDRSEYNSNSFYLTIKNLKVVASNLEPSRNQTSQQFTMYSGYSESYYTGSYFVVSKVKGKLLVNFNEYTKEKRKSVKHVPVAYTATFHNLIESDSSNNLSVLNSFSKQRIEIFLTTLMQTLSLFETQNAEISSEYGTPSKGVKYFNHKLPENLKNKTILIIDDCLPADGSLMVTDNRKKKIQAFNDEIDTILENYNTKYKIVTELEFSKLIEENKDEYLYLHTRLFQSSRYFYFLYDFQSQKVIHLNVQTVIPSSTPEIKMFEKILKKVNKLLG